MDLGVRLVGSLCAHIRQEMVPQGIMDYSVHRDVLYQGFRSLDNLDAETLEKLRALMQQTPDHEEQKEPTGRAAGRQGLPSRRGYRRGRHGELGRCGGAAGVPSEDESVSKIH